VYNVFDQLLFCKSYISAFFSALWSSEIARKKTLNGINSFISCFPSFDTVGWAAGRVSGL